MRIAYLTTDDVNHDLARQTADGCGAILEVLAQGGPSPEAAYDAVLVDWDYLPADGRALILATLLAGQWHCPVAVHGYHLEAKLRHILSQKGVATHCRLEPHWLARWLRQVRRRTDGRQLATSDVNRIRANAKAPRAVQPERRTLREEKMTTTYPETDRNETWTSPARSGDQGAIEVDWDNYQVTLPREISPRPSVPRAEYPAPAPAGRVARMIAVFLDALLLLLPWTAGLFFLGETLDRPEVSILYVHWVQLGTLAVVIGQTVLLSLRGQTLGKMAVGVRVVRASDGSNPGFWRAVVLRSVVPALVLWGCLPAEPVFYHIFLRQLLPVGVTVCLTLIGRFLVVVELATFLKADGRCLHDYLADTKVVEA
jgi:uncharacterized RDD family membrane protein YckC